MTAAEYRSSEFGMWRTLASEPSSRFVEHELATKTRRHEDEFHLFDLRAFVVAF
jgi:hypothetical protein